MTEIEIETWENITGDGNGRDAKEAVLNIRKTNQPRCCALGYYADFAAEMATSMVVKQMLCATPKKLRKIYV
jgi:hypothetical protein